MDTEILNSFRADFLDLSRWFVSDGFMNEVNEALITLLRKRPELSQTGQMGQKSRADDWISKG